MKYKQLLTPALLLFTLCACQNSKSSADKLDELMHLHDEVMAKNDQLVHQQMAIDSLLKNKTALTAVNTPADTAALRTQLVDQLKNLKSAEEKMNEWMYAFDPDISKKNKEEADKYITSEENKLTTIDSIYNIQLRNAELLLKQVK